MKKKIVFNFIVLVVLSLCLAISLSYAWFIDSSIANKVVIKSANISSEITLYKGIDYNYDGNLDLDEEGLDSYEIVEKTTKNEKQILQLDFGETVPNEVHTWKINVVNKGDADGYVYATIHEDVFTNEDNFNLIKFMSISVDDSKVFLYNVSSSDIVFGGTTLDIVKIGHSRDYVFKIQLESFDDLVSNNICSQDEYEKYQQLQGLYTQTSFEFLNVSLSSSL